MASKALVLSGGGPVGIAWETGIAAGLAENGVRLAEADLILGTSAGAVVGAQLAMGRQPQEMLAAQLARTERPAVAAVRSPTPEGTPDLTRLMEVMAMAASADRPLEERLAEVGRFALNAKTIIDEEAFVAGFGSRLAVAAGWTERDFRCTAVDALSGQFVVWDRGSGVPLARAVASSCAVPGVYPPITINGRRYYDGGIRSASNADLAAGYGRVVVVSLTGGAPSADRRAELARERLRSEIAALEEHGAERVGLITPDDESRESFGLNVMDSRRIGPAAENGLRQGRLEAARLSPIWT